MLLDESSIMSFNAEHWKHIKEIFALLEIGKAENVQQYEKTSRLEEDLRKVALESTNL